MHHLVLASGTYFA